MPEATRFTDGRIWTGSRVVESLLIEDGRVVAAGPASEVRRSRPVGAEDRRLGGRLVIPGLVDGHLHLGDLTRVREGFDLHGVASVGDLVDRLARWAGSHPKGTIVGRGWDQERMGGEEPGRRDLERAVPDRPVILYHVSGHAAVLNGAALEAAGFTPRSEPPRGGRLGRGPDGTLDGRLYERALEPLGAIAHNSEPFEPESLARTIRALHAVGLTSVYTLSTSPPEWQALRSLAGSRRLSARVRCYARATLLDRFDPIDLRPANLGGRLAMIGTKAFADGAFGPHTAWLSAPYSDRPHERGEPTLRGPDLDEVITRTLSMGLAPAVHAIGDAAVSEVARALERVRGAVASPSRIEHVGLAPPPLIERLARLEATLVVQPGFVWSDRWLSDRLGTERARWAYPFRSLREAGLSLVGSSDAPYDPVDPWRGLAAAVHRVAPDGASANPHAPESLLPEHALQLYTLNAGTALGEPGVGTLEPGAPADLLLLDSTDLAGAIDDGASGIRETWAAGGTVFVRGGPAER